MDSLERERLLIVVSDIVREYMLIDDDPDDARMSLRDFAALLNSGHDNKELNVSYQTIKNWVDGVYLPRQSWLDGIEEEAYSDSVVRAMAAEINSVLWSKRSL